MHQLRHWAVQGDRLLIMMDTSDHIFNNLLSKLLAAEDSGLNLPSGDLTQGLGWEGDQHSHQRKQAYCAQLHPDLQKNLLAIFLLGGQVPQIPWKNHPDLSTDACDLATIKKGCIKRLAKIFCFLVFARGDYPHPDTRHARWSSVCWARLEQ